MRMMVKFRERHSDRKYPLRSILIAVRIFMSFLNLQVPSRFQIIRTKRILVYLRHLTILFKIKIKRNKQGNFIKFAGRNTNRNERYTGYNHQEN